MSSDTKLILGISLASIAIIIGAVFFLSGKPTTPTSTASTVDMNLLMRDQGYNARGAATPSATIVEFSDFQCPACKATEPILKQILAKYPDTVRLVYRHFPLSQHQFSEYAALAAESAGAQNKFWEMHDLLFPVQDKFDKNVIKDLGKQIKGLDLNKFNKSLNDSEFKSVVSNDLSQGNQLGINSTPTLFINGVKVDNSKPMTLDYFSALIDTAISKSSTNSTASPSAVASPSSSTSSGATKK